MICKEAYKEGMHIKGSDKCENTRERRESWIVMKGCGGEGEREREREREEGRVKLEYRGGKHYYRFTSDTLLPLN